jgi:hypothetical protein
MLSTLSNPYFILAVGVIGFALIGFALLHVSEQRRFSMQSPQKKKVIAALAVAQWPYLCLAAYGIMALFAR